MALAVLFLDARAVVLAIVLPSVWNNLLSGNQPTESQTGWICGPPLPSCNLLKGLAPAAWFLAAPAITRRSHEDGQLHDVKIADFGLSKVDCSCSRDQDMPRASFFSPKPWDSKLVDDGC